MPLEIKDAETDYAVDEATGDITFRNVGGTVMVMKFDHKAGEHITEGKGGSTNEDQFGQALLKETLNVLGGPDAHIQAKLAALAASAASGDSATHDYLKSYTDSLQKYVRSLEEGVASTTAQAQLWSDIANGMTKNQSGLSQNLDSKGQALLEQAAALARQAALYSDLVSDANSNASSIELKYKNIGAGLDAVQLLGALSEGSTDRKSNLGEGLQDAPDLYKYAGSFLAETGWDGPALLNDWIESASLTSAGREAIAFAGIQTVSGNFTGTAADDLVWGESAKDIINGGAGDDLSGGGAEADNLYGGVGNDTLFGNTGDDALSGEAANDPPNRGLRNDPSNDGVRNDPSNGGDGGGAGIDPPNGRGGGAGIAPPGGGGGGAGIDPPKKVGTRIDSLNGGAGNDTLRGGNGADMLLGGVSDDTLSVAAGAQKNTVLVSATDNDTLTDSYYSDTYLVNKGHGGAMAVGTKDRVVFAKDLTIDETFFSRSVEDLFVAILGSDDQRIVSGWFASSLHKVEYLQFTDKTVASSELSALIAAMATTSSSSAPLVSSNSQEAKLLVASSIV
ncbi:calcium-binding protein [Xanthomonas fragariae]|uniref:calcium-binding protein n=1 Tax=Xanthomonas fragariae TaxID=48664 RepID=UPI001ABE0BFB|nr:calcium-binding protein [Xanthomonas fragariae]UKR52163.1 hypothetical protein K4A87_16250 [Xanthomonas fragariae]